MIVIYCLIVAAIFLGVVVFNRRAGAVEERQKIIKQLQFARSVGKRLDEHRETVEAIESKTTLFQDYWHIEHLATQDDYLMRLYHIVHGRWPVDDTATDRGRKWRQSTGEYVRPRPAVLGPCRLPEYPAPVSPPSALSPAPTT